MGPGKLGSSGHQPDVATPPSTRFPSPLRPSPEATASGPTAPASPSGPPRTVTRFHRSTDLLRRRCSVPPGPAPAIRRDALPVDDPGHDHASIQTHGKHRPWRSPRLPRNRGPFILVLNPLQLLTDWLDFSERP